MKYFATSISENIKETPERYLVCLAVPIARTGEQMYHESEVPEGMEADSSGKIVVYRSEKEVFDPQTIASFEGKPLTITHPKGFVGPDNFKELAKGIMQNVRRGDGDFKDSLLADVIVMDAEAIALVRSGLREVSCGYEADYEQLEEGGAGKAEQVNIVGNHLALVRKGRAGASYAINDHQREEFEDMKADKILEGIRKRFGAKVADEMEKEMKDADAGRQDPPNPATGAPAKAVDADTFNKCMDAVMSKLNEISGPKVSDEDKEKMDKEKAAKDAKSKDAEGDETSMEGRLKKLETAVSTILEKMSATADEDGEEMNDDDEEVVGDEEGEEMEDDDFNESTLTGDSASRIEILAPGLDAKSKDVKKKALQTAWATSDGKAAIKKIIGDKELVLDSAEKTEMLFMAASEILKKDRSERFAKTKKGGSRAQTFDSLRDGPMSAEKLNEMNAKRYSQNN